jgi:flagellar protein FlaG
MTDPIGNVGALSIPNIGETQRVSVRPQPIESVAPAIAAAAVNDPNATGSQVGEGGGAAAGDTSAAGLTALADKLNQHLQSQQTPTSLRFQVDKITGEMVISVIDTEDNKVLLQIPSEESLAVAQSLERLQAQLLSQKA